MTGLARPSSNGQLGASGFEGALFGCRRFANPNCEISIGDRPKQHKGIDLLAPEGTDVFAMYTGTVSEIRNNVLCDNQRAHGNRIIMSSVVDGTEYLFFYCHLSNIIVSTSDTVQQGDKIGTTGITGNACYVDNPHLHLEIKRGNTYYDPQNFMTTNFDNNGNVSNTCK